MSHTVSLVRVPNSHAPIKDSISKGLDLIAFKPESQIDSAIIKVNLCYYWQPATGYTTDPQVVAGIIDYLRERYGNKLPIQVAEADATAMRTKHAFLMLGYEKLAKEKNITLLNLSTDSQQQKTVEVNNRKLTFNVPSSLLETKLFINVPKIKIMRATTITCALKNTFGCIATPRKIEYHHVLNEAIVAMNKILRPQLTIVDGLMAVGRFPAKLGLIMASTDPFAVDWVASKIMGYSPSRIEFLRLAMKERLGDPRKITTVGEDVATFQRIFPKMSLFSLKHSWDIQIKLLKLYCRIANDVVPPMLEES